MRARDFLKENIDKTDIHAIVKKFLPFVQRHLELSDLPEIELLDQPLEGTFGRYGGGQIRVMAHGRHPIDVLRTLAHELVHYKQDSEGRIHDDSGETGSDEENEANAVAGVIMRDFDQAHPELLAALKESREYAMAENDDYDDEDGIPLSQESLRDYSRQEQEIIRYDESTAMDQIGYATQSMGPVVKPIPEIAHLFKAWWSSSDADDMARIKKITRLLQSGAKQLPVWIMVEDFDTFGSPHLLEGFHRFAAALELKLPTIPVCYITVLDKNQDMSEGAMSDLDLDIQDEHWDGIVGYVIHGLKTGISPGRMELYLYKWAGNEMFDLDEELRGRGFDSLSELVDHIQSHGGKYVNPTFDLDGLFGDDLDEASDATSMFQQNYQQTQQGLEALKTAGINLVPYAINPKYKNPVYIFDDHGRYTVVVDMGGFTVPFYRSTGMSLKDRVAVDMWYPFFGIGSDGWFNKGSQDMILDFYGSKSLKNIASILDSNLKPARNKINVAGWFMYAEDIDDIRPEFTKVVNNGLNPIANAGAKLDWIANMNNLLKKVNGSQYKLSTQPSVPAPSIPSPANVSTSTEPVVGKLTLSNENSKLNINISTTIGRSVLKRFGDDYKFYSENQFTLEKTPDNQWKLIPNGTATNKTMINGRAVLSPILLTKGMRISVGNPEKKTEKLPLIVMSESVAENFKDGRHPEDKGDSKRLGVPTKASVTTLRRVAKQGGRKGQLAHWQANMKAGRAKKL